MISKYRKASLAAITSLALAIGTCTAAFALVDALIFRPLPIAAPHQLIDLARVLPAFFGPDNQPRESTSFSYPLYQLLRDAASGKADLFAMTPGRQLSLFDDTNGFSENLRAEAISGEGFRILGIRPALGWSSSPVTTRRPMSIRSPSSAMASGNAASAPVQQQSESGSELIRYPSRLSAWQPLRSREWNPAIWSMSGSHSTSRQALGVQVPPRCAVISPSPTSGPHRGLCPRTARWTAKMDRSTIWHFANRHLIFVSAFCCRLRSRLPLHR